MNCLCGISLCFTLLISTWIISTTNSILSQFYSIYNYFITWLPADSASYNDRSDTQTHIFTRARSAEILAKIRAKCGKCWGVLKNATTPTTATSNGALLAVYGVFVCARMPLPMSGYVRGRTTSLPTRKCLRRRDEEAFGKRLRSVVRVFLSFSRYSLFPLLALRTRDPIFPSSKPKLRYSFALCFPRESVHYVVSCQKAKP